MTYRRLTGAAADAAEDLAAGTTTQVDVAAQGDIRLQDAAGGEYVALQAPASLGASYTLTFPADDGDNTEVLSTNGSGVLTWETAGGGGGGGAVSAVANGANDRISTFSSADALNGEANLTFDGSALTVVGEVVVGSGSATGVVESNGNQDVKLQTGNSTTGNITITDGADGAISLTPNGSGVVAAVTGALVVGTGSAEGAVLSSGNHDLSLQTGHSSTGTITIVNGANGDISLEPHGSGGVESAGYFHHEKGIQGAYTAVVANTTLGDDHFIVRASRGAVATITLPAAGNAGRWYFISRHDDGTSDGVIDIDANGSETIDGNLTYHLEHDGDGVALVDDGAGWIVMWDKAQPRKSGFAPDEIENCVIWLSGGVGITTDGSGDVTQWADQSGNSNHAVQLGSVSIPSTATVEGTTVPAFTAGDILNMTTNVIAGNDEPWTVFLCINTSGNAPASTHLFGAGSDANGFLYSAETGFGKKIFVDASNKAGVFMGASDTGAETISAHTLNGTEVIVASFAGPGQVKLDGGDTKWTCSEDAIGTEQGYTKLNLGASSGSGTTAYIDGFTGNYCEVIVYQRALDHSEIILVRQYLEGRWT